MPLPGNVGTGTINFTFTEDDGSASVGKVYFIPPVPYLLDPAADTIVELNTHVVTLNASGAGTQVLVATNDVDLSPINWAWRVRIELRGKPPRSFDISVPGASTQNLADIAPALDADGYANIQDGDKGMITVSGSGTVWTIDNGVVTTAMLSFDVATQAELDAHIADTTDAHDASAISVLDTAGRFVNTNVETVLAEIAGAEDIVFIGSNEMRILSGAPTESTVASGIVHCWLLPDAVTTIVGAYRRLPEWWNTYTIQIVWAPADANAGDARFELRRATVANGAVPTSSGATTVVSTAPGVTDQVVITAATAAVSVPAGDFYGTRVARTGGNAADTYAGGVKLLGILLTRAT